MMARALELAGKGLYSTTPNPRVGCVIAQGETVVGEGWHEKAGGPHAEVVALGQAGAQAAGATLYVNLEPCNHQGRTPPCVDLIQKNKIHRVVAAMVDPNPQAAHGGAKLAAAGIGFEHGLMEEEARELNVGFVSRMTRGRPWVRMKIAATLDGRTALADGRSQWITGAEARKDGHRHRESRRPTADRTRRGDAAPAAARPGRQPPRNSGSGKNYRRRECLDFLRR